MYIRDDFQEFGRELLDIKTSMLEDEILHFWREYAPKLVEELLSQKILIKTVRQKACDMLVVQKSLEELEQLPPVLAKTEAWRELMRLEDEENKDEADKEADWGPWKEEYINLLYKQG
jgi:hypothetical protein